MDFSYPKEEKQKQNYHRIIIHRREIGIEISFAIGILPREKETTQQIKDVSVSKKYFKKAVDRNYFKRVLRETYRLNKHLLIPHLDEPFAFMFFYQTKERLSFDEINTKTILLFEKFVAQQAQKKQTKLKLPILTAQNCPKKRIPFIIPVLLLIERSIYKPTLLYERIFSKKIHHSCFGFCLFVCWGKFQE